MTRKRLTVCVDAPTKAIVESACVEVFPRESIGVLTGWWLGPAVLHINGALAYQAAVRTLSTCYVPDEPEGRVSDRLGDSLVADFHSHPNDTPYVSRIRNYKSRKDKELSDEYGMLHDPDFPGIALVIGLWPAKRNGGWCFRWRAYHAEGSRIYQADMTFC